MFYISAQNSELQPKPWLKIFPLALRIIATIWVVKIVNRQNRDTISAGILTLILPLLLMIVVGLQRKFYLSPTINPKLSDEENSNLIGKTAIILFTKSKYEECIRFSKKALELNPLNEKIKEILKNAESKISKSKKIIL